jgi:mannitol 2-dehydrogenase
VAQILLDRVTKVYANGYQALYGLDLTVADGEFVVLVGPSGCGKTTTLRIVAGLERATEGSVWIGDRVVNDVSPKDRDVAMVFQNYALYPHMTVKQNIAFALRLRKVPKQEIDSRVADAAQLLGLTEWIDSKPSQLSGGQRQRVAMGRAIVREPSAFLMDEPLSNLDAKLRVQMRAEVARIQRRLGVATLYVTHDQVEAMTMGDRVAVMNGGVLQQCDTPEAVYDHPRNLFVASFMGSPPMNLFEATVGESARSIHVGSATMQLPASVAASVPALRSYIDRPIVLGIRPEDLEVLVDGGRADEVDVCALSGVVELVEALGSERLVHFSSDARTITNGTVHEDESTGLNEGTITRAGEGIARVEARVRLPVGAVVRLRVDPNSLRFFDPLTTSALEFEQPASTNGHAVGGPVRPERSAGDRPLRDGLEGSSEPSSPAVLPLRTATLAEIATRLSVPTYDRAAITTGIVHFGVGGFHRAHQAAFIDQLLNAGAPLEWGICGVGVLAADRAMRDALAPQDHLYTLIQKHSDGHYEAGVIGSIAAYLYAPDDPELVIRRLADPMTQIVTLTITEGGYGIDDLTGKFNPDARWITADLDQDATPRSAFGLILAGLAHRRKEGIGPFTVASCDNLEGNGSLTREALTELARLRDPELANWIEQEVAFPNSMVDRITPATTDEDRAQLAARFGVEDRWPVVCEPFTQWVLEDSFSSRRPPLEQASGVQIVSDVAPYELMKLRLLNAGHQGLCYFARLCGYTYVHEAAQDPLFREFLRAYMHDEAAPTLGAVPGVDLDAYERTLIERFSNPEIRDTVARLCAEGSDRIPKWVLPVARTQLARGGPITRSAAIVASWARYAEGSDEQGRPIEIVDRRRDELVALAARQRDLPTAFLTNRALFGELAENLRFTADYVWVLKSLHELGAKRTLEALVALGS